jgi:Tol biopolymer transport system component
VAENVEFDPLGSARFSASDEGTLVYRSGGTVGTRALIWMDRSGKAIGTVGSPGGYDNPRLSPDESQVAVDLVDPARGLGDIWIWDLTRNLGSRFTFTQRDAYAAAWMPDGSGIVFSTDTNEGSDLIVKRLGGSGADSVLYHSTEQKIAGNWSPDGRSLLFFSRSLGSNRGWDIGVLSLGDSARSQPLVATSFNEYHPSISPDGRLVAYASWESGREEIYVQTFGAAGGKWRISTEGGREPQWRGDGRELYYVGPSRALFAVRMESGATPRFSLPEKLFDVPSMITETVNRSRYAATGDGQRFLVVTRQGGPRLGATTVVLDWLAAHGRR